MDLINLWLPLLGVGIFFAAALTAWGTGHQITAVWLCFLAGVTLCLLAALQANDAILKSRIAASQKSSADPDRPWINLKLVEFGELRKAGDEARITLTFIAENVGKTPAVNCQIRAGGEIEFDKRQRLVAARESLLENLDSLKGHAFGTWTLFQGEKSEPFQVEGYVSPTSFKEYSEWFKDAHGVAPEFFSFTVFGALQYEATDGQVAYRTGFAYTVNGYDPQRPKVISAFRMEDGVTPASRITVTNLTDAMPVE